MLLLTMMMTTIATTPRQLVQLLSVMIDRIAMRVNNDGMRDCMHMQNTCGAIDMVQQRARRQRWLRQQSEYTCVAIASLTLADTDDVKVSQHATHAAR